MHYNHFTIEYIQAIKRNLKIQINNEGNALFFPDTIEISDIANLKKDLEEIWAGSHSAVLLLETKHDATVQSGLFGLVNEMDTALKVGFLMGDRVVLIDYLYERLLCKKDPEKINIQHLGVISSSLVNCLSLAEKGRIVIIPSPFGWNPESKKIIEEVSQHAELTLELMALLNMLSIVKQCQLHPYTIAESENSYSSLLTNQIDHVDVLGIDAGKYAYEGILGALLSERLLQDAELKIILDLPLSKYFDVISSSSDFYLKYLSEITMGGSFNAQNNINSFKAAILKSIEQRNTEYLASTAKALTIGGSLGSGVISLLGAVSVISAPLSITGAILALSAALTGSLNSKEKNETPIISVFRKLYTS
jgi:hypothetical protein